MATKTFLKNIVINNKKDAEKFLIALENAERKGRKKVDFDEPVDNVKDAETIKKIFKRN